MAGTRVNVDLDILDYYDGKIKDYVDDKVRTGGLTIDDTLSDTSTNPVQNKVVKQAIDEKADKTTATKDTDGLMSAGDKSKLDDADKTYALKSKYGDTTIDVGRKANTDVGTYSTAEGHNTTASGKYSHAEGNSSTASESCSHAEGTGTTASGMYSHAEGISTTANGYCSHAEGEGTTARGNWSHAGGYYTKTTNSYEFAFGVNNKSNNDTLFSIGDGTADDARHNAFEITKKGGKLHDKDIATTDDIPDLSAYVKTADVPNIKVNAAGNADTLGEKSADDFAQIIELGWNETDTKTAVGISGKTTIYRCTYWTDYPADSPDGQGILIAVNYKGSGTVGTDKMWVTQFFISAVTGVTYKRHIHNIVVDSWYEVYSAGNKPYITGSATVEANSQICVTNHGFMPSAAIWWDSMGTSGVAVSFNETQIVTEKICTSARTVNYLIFK